MTRLEIKAAARRDLREIHQFSVERWGAEIADRYLADIRAAFSLLLAHPRIGPAYPHRRVAMRVWLLRSHRIFYRVGRNRLTIVRVLHKARDADRQL